MRVDSDAMPGQTRTLQRVLILGHTGFIGAALERFFRRQLPAIELIGRSVPVCDLTKEEDVRSLQPLCTPDTAVLMCAAIKRQLGDTLDTFSQNLAMVTRLCKLLQDHPVGRLIFFSSAAVYGEEAHNTRITEATPVSPTSYYGAGKYAAECLLRQVTRAQTASSLLVVRPALIYGPSDPAGAYGPSGFTRAALRGEPITLWGDGDERREFVFIEDVANLVHRLTFHEYRGVLNIVSGVSSTYRDILAHLSGLMGEDPLVTSRPRSKAKVDHGFETGTLRGLFPDVSFTPLEEGIRRTLEAERQALTLGAGVGG